MVPGKNKEGNDPVPFSFASFAVANIRKLAAHRQNNFYTFNKRKA
jgi:hypothetical protein